jgi:hypothetical protein
MDLVINACIQSPLFRNLSHVPADRLAFAHHITSNAPPLSKTKITVEPNVAQGSLDADYQFRIPQFGFLNRVVLRLEYDITPVTRFQVTPLLPLYHIIQEISLRTHHKPIQTIYGKEMLVKHAYFTEPTDKGAKFLGHLNPPARPGLVDLGRMFPSTAGARFDPLKDIAEWTTRKRRVVMMVEVPLASTEAPHVNFDTRFVEHLDLYVKLTSTNGADRPIGMAAGLMEQDMSQEFNRVVGDTDDDGKPGQDSGLVEIFLNTGSPEDSDAYTTEEWIATSRHVDFSKKEDQLTVAGGGTSRADAAAYCYGLVVESDADSFSVGDAVKVTLPALDENRKATAALITGWENGTPTLTAKGIPKSYGGTSSLIKTGSLRATATVTTSTAAETLHTMDKSGAEAFSAEAINVGDLAYVGTTFIGYVHEVADHDSSHTSARVSFTTTVAWTDNDVFVFYKRPMLPPQRMIVRGVYKDTSYTSQADLQAVFRDVYTNPTYSPAQAGELTTVSASGMRLLGNLSLNDNTVDASSMRAGILNFTGSGKTSVATNGPVKAPPCIAPSTSNALGRPANPALPVSWIRVGCCDTSIADYNGWGNATAAGYDELYDKYTSAGTTSAFGDLRTETVWNTDMIQNGGADTNALTTGLANVPTSGAYTTVGAIAKRAVLERYYTLYPHLLADANTSTATTFQTNLLHKSTATTFTTTTDLDWPKLYGGAATGAPTGASGSVANLSQPSNISLTLSCHFLNYHDKIREDIATENFKDNAPATILQYDTQQEVVNAKYGQTGSSYATTADAEMVVHLKSNHLAYAISILAFKDKTSGELVAATSHDRNLRSLSKTEGVVVNDFGCLKTGPEADQVAGNCSFPNYEVVENFKTIKPTYVALKGSGRPIYECGINATPGTTGLSAAFTSQDSSGRVPGAGNCLGEGNLDNLTYQYNKTEGLGSIQGPETVPSDFLSGIDRRIVGEFKDHSSAHIISFGLNTTDQLANSGCLALQTINQPTLHLRFPEACRVYVYVHHFSMIQSKSILSHVCIKRDEKKRLTHTSLSQSIRTPATLPRASTFNDRACNPRSTCRSGRNVRFHLAFTNSIPRKVNSSKPRSDCSRGNGVCRRLFGVNRFRKEVRCHSYRLKGAKGGRSHKRIHVGRYACVHIATTYRSLRWRK